MDTYQRHYNVIYSEYVNGKKVKTEKRSDFFKKYNPDSISYKIWRKLNES
jgi:hypothetical protein